MGRTLGPISGYGTSFDGNQGVFGADWSDHKQVDDKEWEQYLQNVRKQAGRKKQAEDLARELGESSYTWYRNDKNKYGKGVKGITESVGLQPRGVGSINGTSQGTGSNSSTNQFGGDWTSGNGNFSFDKMKTMAKDLSQQQIDHNRQMMDLSSGYRTKEKNLDSGIRMKEADQKFGFEKGLQELSQSWQTNMQDDRFNQDRIMFDKAERQDVNKTRSARSAASNLYYGRNIF
ncbi:MAG: hypothetical protein WBF90_33755 [Rivularia sp. (in: cyanobacteria)]